MWKGYEYEYTQFRRSVQRTDVQVYSKQAALAGNTRKVTLNAALKSVTNSN